MGNNWKILAGGVIVIALLAIIAGGCIASVNNAPASNTSTAMPGANTSTPTAEASAAVGESNTTAPSSSSEDLQAEDQSESQGSSDEDSPADSPQPSASTLPLGVVSGGPMKATTSSGIGLVPNVTARSKLATPQLISPANGTGFTDATSVTFKWKPVTGATVYYIEEQYYDGSAWKKLKSTNVTTCTLSDTKAAEHDTVRWRVTAKDSTGTYINSYPSGWWKVTFSSSITVLKAIV